MQIEAGKLIRAGDIDSMNRPKLADMLAIADGMAYLLSAEPLSETEGDERLTVLIKGEESWGLIEDIPVSADGNTPESYNALILDAGAVQAMLKLVAPEVRGRKESTGRPSKYSMEEEGTYIFFQHIYQGQSINSLAREYKMSPTTVQKLLNQARREAAANILCGNTDMSPDAPRREENMGILRWAVKHSTGHTKAQYEELLARLEN